MKELIPVLLLSAAVIIGSYEDMERNKQIEKLQQQVQQLESKEK